MGKDDVIFSVKSCYNLLMKKMSRDDSDWPWKMIWKSKTPSKVVCFGMRLVLPFTQENLLK
uniref:Putative ovule protein n=1 Tax=Solanum chacoense TaxID=4108 RepID=A0A0V0GXU8_SOLCH